MGRTPGWWVQIVAAAHAAVGVRLYGRTLVDMGRAGVVDTVPDHGERATAFWFLMAAPTLWFIGRRLRAAEVAGDLEAQRATGRMLIATGFAGAAAMPRSGFWALAGIGMTALRRVRAQAGQD